MMATNIVDLRSFYLSPLGQATRQLLRQRLLRLCPNLGACEILALGYATPLLRPWHEQGARLTCLMPATQGAAFWPKEGPNRVAMCDPVSLPLADQSMDMAIVSHGLEGAEDSAGWLREIWRVLRNHGRLLVIVPNRRGLWARSEATPFGHGQPFSPSQLQAMLREQNFVPERLERALVLPPWFGRLTTRLAPTVERWGDIVLPAFGGVLLAEASKQLYAPLRVAAHKRRPIIHLLPTPQ
jgi:SAM-dependent methyltransferase